MSSYADSRVLLFGASGFIGRWVARQLTAAGAHLVCPVRDVGGARMLMAEYGIVADVVPVDLLDAAAVVRLFDVHRPTITFNLAGYGIDRSEQDETCAWRINAELVGRLGELVQPHTADSWTGMRLVHTGSALEYGAIGGDLAEDSIPNPTTLYGQTKLAGTRSLVDRGLPNTVTARLFTVYGAGEHAGRLLPTLLEARRLGTTVPLSPGSQQRDFTYVEDVADGLLRLGLLPSVPGGVVNLATGTLCSVRSFAQTSASVLGIPAERLDFGALQQRNDEMPHEPVSVDRLRQSIAWVPGTSVANGVLRTARFLDAVAERSSS